jgi:hypothetical protein
MRIFFLIAIFLINEVTRVLCNEKLFIKWVVDSHIPSQENFIELEQVIPKYLREDVSLVCTWNKLNSENQLIDEANHNTQKSYVYKTSTSFCNLIVLNYNFDTNEQIDFYKPVLKIRSNSGVEEYGINVYALAYLKSFEIIKKEHDGNNSFIDSYKCRAIFIVPYSNIDENLNKKIEDKLNENVAFSFNLVDRKKVIDRINSRNLISKRDTFKHFISITLENESVDVMKSNKVNDIFTCELNLVDEKNRELYYRQFIHEKFDDDNADETNSTNCSDNLKQYFQLLIFLLIFSYELPLKNL